jgi:uncharacterized protein
MADIQVTRPDPGVTEDSEFFWEAAAGGRLVAQRCAKCGILRHPPRPMCPHCASLEIDVVPLTGYGTVYSYAILHHPQNPAFEYPVKAVLVELDEGIRMVSSLKYVEPHEIRIGMRVQVDFEPTVGGNAVPVFRPEN